MGDRPGCPGSKAIAATGKVSQCGIYNNFGVVPMSFLSATFFDPMMPPIALKVIVYLLPLTYTSLGLQAVAYLPLAQFPWYVIPVLVLAAIVLSAIGHGSFQISKIEGRQRAEGKAEGRRKG